MTSAQNLNRQYLHASAITLFAKGFVIIAGMGILWLLNALSGKEGFGIFMIALSACLLISGIVGSAFQSLILYHCARYHGQSNTKDSRALAGLCLTLVLVTTFFIACIVWICAEPIAQYVFDKPALAPWLRILAFMIPCQTINLILSTWHRAHQHIQNAIIFGEILPFAIRIVALALLWFIKAPLALIGWIFIASAGLPALWLYLKKPAPLSLNFKQLTRWDIGYGLKSSLTQVINKPTRGLDMLLLGMLAPATAAADYAIALRFAQLLLIPKQTFAQLLIPRLATLMDSQNTAGLWLEYNAARQASLILTLAGCIFFVIAGPFLLSLFGSYDHALPILFVLCITNIISAGFGMAGGTVSIAGYAGCTFIIGIVSFMVMLPAALFFIPIWEDIGAGVMVSIGILTTMVGFTYVLWIFKKHFIMPWLPLLAMGFSLATISTYIMDHIGLLHMGIMLSIIMVMYATLDRSLLTFIRQNGRLWL